MWLIEKDETEITAACSSKSLRSNRNSPNPKSSSYVYDDFKIPRTSSPLEPRLFQHMKIAGSNAVVIYFHLQPSFMGSQEDNA